MNAVLLAANTFAYCLAWDSANLDHCTVWGTKPMLDIQGVQGTVTANQSSPRCDKGWTLVIDQGGSPMCAKELKPADR